MNLNIARLIQYGLLAFHFLIGFCIVLIGLPQVPESCHNHPETDAIFNQKSTVL
ncbi:unnamed protein product [Moneuplotes crassus]|uniref:Uncharacterized protein n=1 Tax=Euplotes crassus TaxID=5936 RepID=A0AAD1Y543_EUPCR|nr:unnamed protein product [Moneuplotes crassus]